MNEAKPLASGGTFAPPEKNQSENVPDSGGVRCNCKKPGQTGMHKAKCPVRKAREASRTVETHHVQPDTRFAPPTESERSEQPLPDSQVESESLGNGSGAQVHSLVPSIDRFTLTSESITAALRGVEKVCRRSIANSGNVIGGETFTDDALKGTAVDEERYSEITERGAIVLRKHGLDFAWAEEVAYGASIVSAFGPLIYAAKTLSDKADEILKRGPQPEQTK